MQSDGQRLAEALTIIQRHQMTGGCSCSRDAAGSMRRNITLDPEVDRKAHLLAKYTSRKFSNLIELCLRQKITEMELNGWIPEDPIQSNKQDHARNEGSEG